MRDVATIIRGLQVTEKGTYLREMRNQYLFEVARDANKIEIKRAVEQVFKVSVRAVRTMNCRGKLKRERTARHGRRPDWKRAVVTLTEGSAIEVK